VSLKKTPAYAGEPKRPRIWSFLAELFRNGVFLFFLSSESLCGEKNRESDGLTKLRPFLVEPQRGGPDEGYPEYQLDLFSCTSTANLAAMTEWPLNSKPVLIAVRQTCLIRSRSNFTEKLHHIDPRWPCAGCLHAKCTQHEPQYEVGSPRSGSRHTHMPCRLIPHPIDPTSDPGSIKRTNLASS
jgi:hypothetical protein